MGQYELFNMISKVVIIYVATKRKEFIIDIAHEYGLRTDKITKLALEEFKRSKGIKKYKIKEFIIKYTEPAINLKSE